MDTVILDGYIDKGFAYALVVYLLWRDRDIIKGVKESLDKLSAVVEKLSLIISERMK